MIRVTRKTLLFRSAFSSNIGRVACEMGRFDLGLVMFVRAKALEVLARKYQS